MMRRCIVDKCNNTDHIILCHRFPKNRILAQKWQLSLNLTDCPLDTLISKYTVCCQHFDYTDYRNSVSNSLNATAVPKLNGNKPRPYRDVRNKTASEEESRQPSPTNCLHNSSSPANGSDSIELLQDDDATEIDESLASNPPSSDELCILSEELNATDELIQSIDGADFTMLDAAGCAMYLPYVGEENKAQQQSTDESTAVVLPSRDSSDHLHDIRPGSTDSDVEVLVSEAIFDSHWFETDRSAVASNTAQTNTSNSPVSPCISYVSNVSNKSNAIGIMMLDSEFGHLDRLQLIEIIKSQSATIQQLESKLNTYKLAQEQLFMHFDAFRNAICGVHM